MNTVEPIRNINDIEKIENLLHEKSSRDLLLFTLGINCGLRISDILALNVGNVCRKDYIDIFKKKTGKHKRLPINLKLRPMLDDFTNYNNVDIIEM